MIGISVHSYESNNVNCRIEFFMEYMCGDGNVEEVSPVGPPLGIVRIAASHEEGIGKSIISTFGGFVVIQTVGEER